MTHQRSRKGQNTARKEIKLGGGQPENTDVRVVELFGPDDTDQKHVDEKKKRDFGT